MEEYDGEAEVMISWSASSNHSFRGQASLEITHAEWADMDDKTKDEIVNSFIYNLVDVWVED